VSLTLPAQKSSGEPSLCPCVSQRSLVSSSRFLLLCNYSSTGTVSVPSHIGLFPDQIQVLYIETLCSVWHISLLSSLVFRDEVYNICLIFQDPNLLNNIFISVLRIRIPDPESGAFFDLWIRDSGWVKKKQVPDPG
jgi:hypothetical protein